MRHRVVIIGAGFGGIAAARELRHAPVDVTIVDANNFHTFQPLLYQVATAGLDADDIGYPVRGIFRRQPNLHFRMASVTAVDIDRSVVTTDVGEPLPFDSLIVAAGAVSTSYGVPGVDEHAFALKSLEDALVLRQHVLARFEQVAVAAEPPGDGALTVVICGGGPTGVELAGGMVELFQHVLANDFRQHPEMRAHVVLVEAADRLLGTFSPESGRIALDTLTRRGVEVITGVGVAEVTPHAVSLQNGRSIDARTVVWAAGVRANPLAQMLGVPLAKNGRIIVGDDLAVVDHPNIYAVGDIAADADQPLPQVAQPAIQGGRHAARQIVRRLRRQPTEPLRYRDKGSMATIGRHEAVAELPHGPRLHGLIGWLAWLGLHIVYLMGFRNRINVLVNWAWNYVTYDRGARLIAGSEESLQRSSPRCGVRGSAE